MNTIIFACVHNAGRSQMAAAFFNSLVNPELARAISAGTAPAARVHPEVQEAMLECGVDLSDASPRLLTTELLQQAGMLITMGCGEHCPVAPGVEVEDWPLQDPKGQTMQSVRRIRDDIQQRVRKLAQHKGWLRAQV